jgi:hypothetical protein
MKPLFAAAVAALLVAPSPPFPAPKLTAPTPDTKCDWGPITEVRANGAELTVKTDAGSFEVKLGPSASLAGADGKPLASRAELRPGRRVRVYYVVDNKVGGGARAQEIDVIE